MIIAYQTGEMHILLMTGSVKSPLVVFLQVSKIIMMVYSFKVHVEQ
jgi:hypothetical protein